jgi:hypothetical protein
VKKDSFDAVLIELKYLTDSFLVDSSYFETLTNYFRHIQIYLSMNQVEKDAQYYPVLLETLCKLFSVLELTMTKLGNVMKNLKSIYPSGSDRDINALLDILHEVTSLNELLNRSSSIHVFQSIKIHLQVRLKSKNYIRRSPRGLRQI